MDGKHGITGSDGSVGAPTVQKLAVAGDTGKVSGRALSARADIRSVPKDSGLPKVKESSINKQLLRSLHESCGPGLSSCSEVHKLAKSDTVCTGSSDSVQIPCPTLVRGETTAAVSKAQSILSQRVKKAKIQTLDPQLLAMSDSINQHDALLQKKAEAFIQRRAALQAEFNSLPTAIQKYVDPDSPISEGPVPSQNGYASSNDASPEGDSDGEPENIPESEAADIEQYVRGQQSLIWHPATGKATDERRRALQEVHGRWWGALPPNKLG